MTIIAWDMTQLATDSMISDEDSGVVLWLENKIERTGSLVYACCGPLQDRDVFKKWLESCEYGDIYDPVSYPKKALSDDFEAIVIHVGDAYYYTSKIVGMKIPSRYSIGESPAVHYCNALMDVGFSASEAVERVCDYSAWCGKPVNTFTIALKITPPDKPTLQS